VQLDGRFGEETNGYRYGFQDQVLEKSKKAGVKVNEIILE